MKPAFAHAVQGTRSDGVYLVHGGCDHTNRPAWYFIRVGSVKLRAFLKAISGGKIDLVAYGDIIESGYGETPPENIVAYMRTQFGYKG